LAEAQLPSAITNSEPRFRELLELGTCRIGEKTNIALQHLAEAQWSALEKFATAFFNEFESYAPLELFPAFRNEVQRRGRTSYA
jgi:hypothetical protein